VEPETRYVAGGEGQLAYQVVGEGAIDLVYLTGSTSHVDVRWEIPQFASFNERLAAFSRMIAFDRLGNGASDRAVAGDVQSLADWVEDLRAVLDRIGSERTAILAVADAGPMAMLFAATYPDRVSALILANTSARWMAREEYSERVAREDLENLVKLIAERWGTEEYAVLVCPSLAEDQQVRRLWARQLRASTTPRVAAAQVEALLEVDLRAVLRTIRARTLVLHRRNLGLVPIDHARYIAEQIPNAKLIELDGADIVLPFGDPDPVIVAVEEFLTGGRRSPDPNRALATVLFTDLVQSTAHAAEFGDRKWAQLLARHDGLIRDEVERFRGRVWKTIGDGVLATFAMPRDAIECARSIRGGVAELGLEMRAGMHAGEVEIRDQDVGGIAVHVAARVAAMAQADEILLSRTVADLVAGSGIALAARGTRTLKGVPGRWQLYGLED
jgi:class 3 adenylate cyclase